MDDAYPYCALLHEMDYKKYENLHVCLRNEIAFVGLNHGIDNSLDPEMIDELIQVHEQVAGDSSVRGLLLYSEIPGFFCNGIDLELLLENDRAGRVAIFGKLMDMIVSLYSFPDPHVCLVEGYAMAGGAVLASLPDFALCSGGSYRICFSELRIGLVLPEILLDLLRTVVTPPGLKRIAFLSEAFKPVQALEVGLVAKVLPRDGALRRAEAFLKKMYIIPSHSFQRSKANMRRTLIASLRQKREETLAELEEFLGPDLDDRLHAAIGRSRRP